MRTLEKRLRNRKSADIEMAWLRLSTAEIGHWLSRRVQTVRVIGTLNEFQVLDSVSGRTPAQPRRPQCFGPPEGAEPFSFGLKPFLKGKAPRLRAAENERSVVQCHCVRCAHRGSPASSALVSATNENANYVRISRAAGSHR